MFAFSSKPELLGFGLNYKRAFVGDLLEDRHNVESPRKDFCFVHAHLIKNAETEELKKVP